MSVSEFCRECLRQWLPIGQSMVMTGMNREAMERLYKSGYLPTEKQLVSLFDKIESYVLLAALVYGLKDIGCNLGDLYLPIGEAYDEYLKQERNMPKDKALEHLKKIWGYTESLMKSANREIEESKKRESFLYIAGYCLVGDWISELDGDVIVKAKNYAFPRFDLVDKMVKNTWSGRHLVLSK